MGVIGKTIKSPLACVASWRDSCARGTFIPMPREGFSRAGKPRGKLTCIPTLLEAPPPKQYSTPSLIPPATKAKSPQASAGSYTCDLQLAYTQSRP